ncbi:MAG: aminotransferase class V-fold PLP-dependent enzyme, partial [bacterium]
MTPDEFCRHGRQVIDWIADYMENVDRYSVYSRIPSRRGPRAPAPHAPQQGEPFEQLLADMTEIILPGITHWQSPNFFAFFPANNSGASILGDLLSSGLGVQGMLWSTSPACTELEAHVLDWVADMLDLPAAYRSSSTGGGVIEDSASSAVLCALLAARETRTDFTTRACGVDRQLTAYASIEAQSSVEKAMNIAGLGTEQLRRIGTDASRAMRPDALEAAIRHDAAHGFEPCFVCVTVGTTSSGALDPLGPIGEICHRHGLWLHVDAAMFGTAALCPEYRTIQA